MASSNNNTDTLLYTASQTAQKSHPRKKASKVSTLTHVWDSSIQTHWTNSYGTLVTKIKFLVTAEATKACE